MRHPDNENGELLQHCGPWPISVAQEKPTIGYPLAFDHPGAVETQAKVDCAYSNTNVTLVGISGGASERRGHGWLWSYPQWIEIS